MFIVKKSRNLHRKPVFLEKKKENTPETIEEIIQEIKEIEDKDEIIVKPTRKSKKKNY